MIYEDEDDWPDGPPTLAEVLLDPAGLMMYFPRLGRERTEMTDRHAGYVVSLESNIREDDAARTIAALEQIKGVLAVSPITADPMLMVAEARVRIAFQKLLLEWLNAKTEI